MNDQQDLPEFVNVYGQNVPAEMSQKTGEIMVPLSAVRGLGFNIYKKSQYNKLLITDKQLSKEFNLHLLSAAKNYMIDNRHSFVEQEVIESINRVKHVLIDKTDDVVAEKSFLKHRQIESKANGDDLLQVRVINSPRPSSPIKRKAETSITSPNPERQNLYQQGHSGNGSPSNKADQSRIINFPTALLKLKTTYHVTVTCVVNDNRVYVRNSDNEQMYEDIYNKLLEDVAEMKIVKYCDFKKIYAAKPEADWVRCKITSLSPLRVFFLDYGNISKVDELREISENLQKFPAQAINISFDPSEYQPVVEDDIIIECQRFNRNHVDVNYEVKVISQIYFNLPDPSSFFEDNERVSILSEQDLVLYLRTRECFKKLGEIAREIDKIVSSENGLLPVVKEDQLILCQNGGTFCRAQVAKIEGDLLHVNYIDYQVKGRADVGSVRNINGTLSQIPVTYFASPSLKNVKVDQMTNKCREFIQQCIADRTKFSIMFKNQHDFDLLWVNENKVEQSLVESLRRLSKEETTGTPKPERNSPRQLRLKEEDKQTIGVDTYTEQKTAPRKPGRLYLEDMDSYKPPLGVNTYLHSNFISIDNVTLVAADAISDNSDKVLMEKVADTTPYRPDVQEVCLGVDKDEWFRCVAISKKDDQYEVLFIDFGNTAKLNCDQLRKLPEQCKTIPILGISCRLVGLPNRVDIERLIENRFTAGEFFEIDVKELKDGKYSIEVPAVYGGL